MTQGIQEGKHKYVLAVFNQTSRFPTTDLPEDSIFWDCSGENGIQMNAYSKHDTDQRRNHANTKTDMSHEEKFETVQHATKNNVKQIYEIEIRLYDMKILCF